MFQFKRLRSIEEKNVDSRTSRVDRNYTNIIFYLQVCEDHF